MSVLGAIAGAVVSGMFAKRQAKKQMDFQAQQSATAHQREVEDLRAAGLNPILSGTGGVGASTPAGAMANVDIVSSAKMGALVEQELKNLKETQKNIEADTNRKIVETDILGEQWHSARAKATYDKKSAEFFREGNIPGDLKFYADQLGLDANTIANIFKFLNVKGIKNQSNAKKVWQNPRLENIRKKNGK